MNKIARVLITDAAIPAAGYGSWSQRIEYLLQQFEDNRFDYLISEYTNTGLNSKHTHRYNCKQDKSRLLNKLLPGWRYRSYTRSLDEILSKHPKAIVCIVDTLRVKKFIWQHIKQNNLQSRVKLVYYQCGFSKYISPADYERFVEGVDECIYLTRNAYRFDLLHNSSMPFPVNILHNPIDHHKFFPPGEEEKKVLRESLGMGEGIHFIWGSYDRPKKGLEVVLDAWLKFYDASLNVQLHVVGVNRQANYPGVKFYGKVHSDEMHRWFKAVDIGVFSSLWPEGFSLSLAEQISCGLFCIASTAGCVKEYFVPGKHGIAIDEPNIVAEWVSAFHRSMHELPGFRKATIQDNTNPPFLTYDAWCQSFQQIFDNIEKKMLFE